MIYAVNNYSKEHLLITGDAPELDDWRNKMQGWYVVKADADGWIEWSGGGDNPLPTSHSCEVRASASAVKSAESWRFNWRDIIAYRPILEPQGEQQKEWNGEGYPPVGKRCLMQSPILGMWANQWLEVEVLAIRGSLAIGWCEEKSIAIWSGKLACKPIRTDRERWIEAAMAAGVKEAQLTSPDTVDGCQLESALGAIYDAGLARLPWE